MKLLKILYPFAYYKKIYDIPLERLKNRGIKGLIFDIDNTLAPYFEPLPDSAAVAFINRAVSDGFIVCLLSNNTRKRVTLFNEMLNVHAVHMAMKPSRRGLRRAMRIMGTSENETVLVGDQVFTDVLCGNRAKVKAILVAPCSEKDDWRTKFKRGAERKVIESYLKSRGKRGSTI